MQTIKLSNGVEMPILGYGVYQVTPEECERCVSDALSVGYRMIDTAQAYYNEEGVGRAVKKSGIPREELFLVTKVWISNAGYEKAKASIDESLRKLQTDYIDLLLIHQPFNDYYGTYRAMEEAYKAGKLRAIGVSNFYPDRFIDLAEFCDIKPMVNQVETHVFNQQRRPQEIMKEYGTQIMSWGPFAEGRNDFFTNPVLVRGTDRPALPHPARRGSHPEVHAQGAHGAEPRCIRLLPFRRRHGGHRQAGQGRKPVLLALCPRDGKVAG